MKSLEQKHSGFGHLCRQLKKSCANDRLPQAQTAIAAWNFRMCEYFKPALTQQALQRDSEIRILKCAAGKADSFNLKTISDRRRGFSQDIGETVVEPAADDSNWHRVPDIAHKLP